MNSRQNANAPASIDRRHFLGIDLPEGDAGRKLPICWRCPNGVEICVEHDPDDPMPPA